MQEADLYISKYRYGSTFKTSQSLIQDHKVDVSEVLEVSL